jgi:hypothetical protein
MVPALILLVTGCGGISASHSVSPASFFLPGLLKADPQQPERDSTNPNSEPARQANSSAPLTNTYAISPGVHG